MPEGALIIWHDMPDEQREEMLDWYDREHHAERVAIDGFLCVRRYHAVEAARQLFIHYETTGPQVLSSDAYLERVNNPTPWSLKCQKLIRNNSRTVCRLLRSEGRAKGGFVITAAFRRSGDESAENGLEAGLDLVGSLSGVLSWQAYAADAGTSSLPSTEKKLRGAADDHVTGLIVAHATELAAARAVRDAFAAAGNPAAGQQPELGLFQLAFSLGG